ncbi:MAG: hypothetical protein IH602_00995 [Bryobacteraceae bacterium]|nr:hypothetical protein [Bryobacteraceae bacterium]
MSPVLRLSLVAAAAALSLAAQGIKWGGPISGLVYDSPTKSLRQILGFPGGARLGPALLEGIEWAAVSPAGKAALVVVEAQARLVTSLDLAQGAPGLVLDGLTEEPKLARWAEDSSWVVVYSSAGRSLQRVLFTSANPVVEPPVAIDGLDEELTALASDRTGETLAAVTAKGVVLLLTRDGVATPLLPQVEATAIAINREGTMLWAADRALQRIIRFPIGGPDSVEETVLSDPEKLADVTVLGVSADGKRLTLADRSALLLHQLDIDQRSLDEGLQLDAPATALYPLGDPGLKLLSPRGKQGEPLYLLDERRSPSVFFVPASSFVPASEKEQAQ